MSLTKKGDSRWYVQLMVNKTVFNAMLYCDTIEVAGQLERRIKQNVRVMLDAGKTVDECKAYIRTVTEESRSLNFHKPNEPKPVKETPQAKHKRKGHTLEAVFARAYEEHFSKLKDGIRSKIQLDTILESAKKVLNTDDPLITDLTASSIKLLQNHIAKERGIESSTVNRYFAALKKTLNMAYKEWEIISGVPFIKMSSEEVNARTTVITPQEETLMIHHLRGKNKAMSNDIADLFEILLGSGLRLSEALGMTYSKNVDFEHNVIMLHDKRKIKNKQLRTVPLTNRVREILEQRKASGSDNVFNLNIYSTEQAFARAKRELGITNPEFCFHACRHSYASRLVEKGIDLYSVKHLLGHKVITTTERYAHMNKSKLQEAVAVLN